MDETMRAWWREGCLSLMPANAAMPVEVARGPLAELILTALALRPAERPRAIIDLDGADLADRLTWPQILELSSHPEFPMII